MTEDSSNEIIQIDKMSIDQLAGAVVLIFGAIGSLLLVIWQSKCHCKINLCYIFTCERRPPNEEEMKGLKEQSKKLKEMNKKEDKILDKEEEILDEITPDGGSLKTSKGGFDVESQKGTPRLIPKEEFFEVEPEPESIQNKP